MLLKAIRLSVQRSNLASPNELSEELALAKASVCSFNSFDCLDRTCNKCRPSVMLLPLLQDWLANKDASTILYTKWCRVSELVNKKEITKMKKIEKCGTRLELLADLVDQMERYPLHIKNAVSQLKAYKSCKASLKKDEALVVCDFAENYVCRQHAEAQNAYYSRNRVTVHSMVAIFSSDSAVKRDSIIAISDDLRHDSSAVKVFIQTLVHHFRSRHPNIKHIIIWSDGCGAQYKSRQPMINIAKAFQTGFKIS